MSVVSKQKVDFTKKIFIVNKHQCKHTYLSETFKGLPDEEPFFFSFKSFEHTLFKNDKEAPS